MKKYKITSFLLIVNVIVSEVCTNKRPLFISVTHSMGYVPTYVCIARAGKVGDKNKNKKCHITNQSYDCV
jgi:hypothetical protein